VREEKAVASGDATLQRPSDGHDFFALAPHCLYAEECEEGSTMIARSGDAPSLKFHPLTPRRWKDLETLFGERGACAGCWCMWWRLKRSQWERQKGEANRRALKRIVDSGTVPGILAYHKGEPVGWCSVGPRSDFPALERSRILKPVDETAVWSVVCFFIARPYRKTGVSIALLKAAIAYAGSRGCRILEGYPVEPKKGKTADAFAWTGLASSFRQAGFKEVCRRSDTRPIMRYRIA
jgi:GNAT superfamily N-acetyltransferase